MKRFKSKLILKALLSHRYGCIPLPTRLINREYEIFQNEIKNNEELRNCDDLLMEFNDTIITNLLEWCYQLDENEMPQRYKLRRIDEILAGFEEKVTTHPSFKLLWLN